MNPDIFTTILPGQVHFGFGAIGLVDDALNALGAERVFIVADPGVMTAGLVEPMVAPLKAANFARSRCGRCWRGVEQSGSSSGS